APGATDLRESSPRYLAATASFRRRVALAHLHLIAALLASGGAGVLASDVDGRLLSTAVGPHRIRSAAETDATFDVLPRDVLDLEAGVDLVQRFERVGEPRRWCWLVNAPRGDTPGRAYDMVGLVLRPRPRDLLQ